MYIGDDLLSGWIYAGLTALGMTIGGIAPIAAPVAVIWAQPGRRLEQTEPVAADASL